MTGRKMPQRATRPELEAAAELAVDEAVRARTKFGPMAGAHEAYAVILEELDEFLDSVRADCPDRTELVQTAAMCLCAIVELDFRDRRAAEGKT